MRPMGAILEAIQAKLTAAFQPIRLEVVDDSARHAPLPRRARDNDHILASAYWRVMLPTVRATSCVLFAVTVRGAPPWRV